jgi:Kef-type K+ transport system membrane component KefB
VILIGSVILLELIGVHAIVGGFIVGLILSSAIDIPELGAKIRSLGYALFIPIFFLSVGASLEFDATVQGSDFVRNLIVLGIALVSSKVLSGYIASRVVGYSPLESLFAGWATTPQLSTTLAVAFTAGALGVISSSTTAILIIISMATTFVAPILLREIATLINKKEQRENEETLQIKNG